MERDEATIICWLCNVGEHEQWSTDELEERKNRKIKRKEMDLTLS